MERLKESTLNHAKMEEVYDFVIPEEKIEKRVYDENTLYVVRYVANRVDETMNDFFDKDLKLLKEWIEKTWYEDESVSLVAEENMNKVDSLVAKVKENLNEEVENVFREEQNEKN